MLQPVSSHFFNKEACQLAKALLGKLIVRKYNDHWLIAQIVETESYYLNDKGSHASLGFTEKRKALFMQAGTIYMYYARGKDSLNISAEGKGNAVLIKGAIPYRKLSSETLNIMHQLNPLSNNRKRPLHRLCSGQTLLCKSLNLKVKDWDQQTFKLDEFYIATDQYQPKKIIQTTRLGIPKGRDENLPYRYIDYQFAHAATKNPLTLRKTNHYQITLM
ncbi:MAG: DNA-3-methyladenine glycosylase [Gammaproteobacteria bacterium]|nr:MAG: DNA-3-methyladenine glycosylase [Gammaproteobacteria bacterium]UTW43710.1 DNA-3-methyladenine glycosylase [bacterium SCSIO 12844]